MNRSGHIRVDQTYKLVVPRGGELYREGCRGGESCLSGRTNTAVVIRRSRDRAIYALNCEWRSCRSAPTDVSVQLLPAAALGR